MKVEKVEIKIRVPKPIVDFLKDCGTSIESWLDESLIDFFGSNLNISYDHPDIFGEPNADIPALIEKHRLEQVPELEGHIEKGLKPLS